MADNTILPVPTGATNGDTVRDIDRSGVKTQVVQLDIGGAAAESLVTGTMPVSGSITVANASLAVIGTFWQATQPVSLASTSITGTVAATQSGTWNVGSITTLPALVAGSAVIGKVSIDQTTPGTTNLVSIGTNGTVAINAAIPTGANVIGALTANQSVNNTQINGVALLAGNGITGTGSQRVTIASDNTAFPVNATLSAETTKVIGTINIAAAQTLATVTTVSTVTNLSQMGGAAITMNTGVVGTGVQRVVLATDVALPTGANTIGAVNIAASQTIAVTQATAANLNATVTPATPTASIINSAATTNATSIKASTGTLYSITVSNAGAAAAFVKLYNLAAAPTVGTSVIALTISVAASGVVTVPFGTMGMRFGTGIALAITNLVGEADATAVAANQVKVMASYI